MSKYNTRKSKNKHRDTDENDMGTDSETSVSVTMCPINESVYFDKINDFHEKISISLDNLLEKQSSKRIEGLQVILKLLRGAKIDATDMIIPNKSFILDAILRMVRNLNSESECILCLELFAVVCLVLGPDNDDLIELSLRWILGIFLPYIDRQQ